MLFFLFLILEKARLQAEAKAAEEARKKAEAEAAAEGKRKRELEREAARQALQKVRNYMNTEGCSLVGRGWVFFCISFVGLLIFVSN